MASFLNDPKHRLIELVSKDLAKEQKSKLLDRLNICYQESSEGNGDAIPQGLALKSLKDFSEMNEEEKQAHTKELRGSYLRMEQENSTEN